MVDVYVGIGSNVERELHIVSALKHLKTTFGPLLVSSVYESDPVGFAGDPFYNMAVKLQTTLPLVEVNQRLTEIERQHGRSPEDRKFAPRKLDLDLLLYGELVLHQGGRSIPRADILRYGFVLEPLAEIAPHLEHPELGQTMAELWGCFDKSACHQHPILLPGIER